jgi:L-ascorbate 6-phosphate lactonase
VTAALPTAIEAAAVPDGAVRLWRLPQSGFVVRGGGRTVLLDPWLSARLEAETSGDPHPVQRVSPPPCRAEELPEADLVCCTHEHPDHLDPETLAAIATRSPRAVFVVPAPLADEVAAAGIDAARVVGVEVEQPRTIAGVELLALPAAHALPAGPGGGYDFWRDDDGRHRAVGYVLRLGGVTVFHAGDTVRTPGDAERLRAERVDVALLPVNGRDWMRETRGLVGNLEPSEAVDLAAAAGIPQLVLCHFDWIVGNTGDPSLAIAYAVAERLPLGVHLVGADGLVVTR